jgi:hypothetical protein
VNIDLFKALPPYEQAVILLLEDIKKELKKINAAGEE